MPTLTPWERLFALPINPTTSSASHRPGLRVWSLGTLTRGSCSRPHQRRARRSGETCFVQKLVGSQQSAGSVTAFTSARHRRNSPASIPPGRLCPAPLDVLPTGGPTSHRSMPPRRLSLSRDGRLALWLMGGAAVLLLLACVNVTGLLWTQTLNRARETAVRLQLGASRGRVFVQLLVEHLMTAAIGGAVALAVAAALGQAVQRYFPYAAGAELMTARTLVVVGLLAFLAGVSSGVVPVVHASRAGAERFLRTGHSLAASRSRWRTMLLSLQIAIALVLAVAAGLFVASVRKFHQDFSYDLDHVIAASIDFRTSNTRTPLEVQGIFEILLQRVQQMPQVESAALSSAPVLESGGWLRVFGVRRTMTAPADDAHAGRGVTCVLLHARPQPVRWDGF